MSDCNVLVANAIAADRAKEYDTAMVLYRTTISMLLGELEMKRGNAHQRQHLKQRVKQLLGRAEELQRYLNGLKKFPSTPFASDKHGHQLTPGKETTATKPKQDKRRTPRDKVTERHDNQGNVDAGRDREWAFHFDLRFDMQSKIKTPTPLPEDKNEKVFSLMNLLRFLPVGGQ